MIVEDKVRVTGRGWIICTKFDGNPIHINDKFSVDGKIFDVVGIEAFRYNVGSPIGLLFRPNQLAGEIEIGKEIIKIGLENE